MHTNNGSIRQKIQLAWNRAKRTIEWLAYAAFDRAFVRLPPPTPRGVMVLVSTQLLGDYVILSPYAKACVKHWQHQGFRVVMLCNAAWEPLATTDIHPDATVTLDRRKFTRDPRYRAGILHELRNLGAEIAVCASLPRSGIIDDACMRAIAAPRAVGIDCTYPDRPRWDVASGNSLFSDLTIQLPGTCRTQWLADLVTAAGVPAPSGPNELSIGCPHPDTPANPYFVISPSASTPNKVWPADRFVEIAKRALQAHPDLHCVLVGAPPEYAQIEAIRQAIGDKAVNMAGRNSLTQLHACIRDAVAVLGNDSAAIHIAASQHVPSVVAMNGATIGVCLPYPEKPPSPVFPVAPSLVMHHMSCYGCGGNCRFPIKPGTAYPCLDAVSVDQVWKAFGETIALRLEVIPTP